MSIGSQEQAIEIRVYGLVQGVGFRPFIYNLATSFKLSGWALNRNDCVQIRVQGAPDQLAEFIRQIPEKAPPLSRVESIFTEETKLEAFTDFKILHSESHSVEVTRVSPDVAVCQECLADMQRQANRINYPFVNCTNCGPRFSIIQDLPYDRHKTTMSSFILCDQCQQEYEDITNRRFHAQPNACRDCGPEYELMYEGQRITGIEQILETTCKLLERGKIVAIKGIGGFHLACDATNETAVAELRRRKQRESKPFAVLFRNLETAREYAEINDIEAQLLLSEKRPILLLKKRGWFLSDNTPLPHTHQTKASDNTPLPPSRGDLCRDIPDAEECISEPDIPPLRGVGGCCPTKPMPASLRGAGGCCLASTETNGDDKELAPSVARGLNTLGIMLPYTPFHYLLVERLKTDAIVLTSGNISDEPIVIANAEAATKLSSIADALLVYNREIHNRSDDSVVSLVNGTPRLLRRSRGYVPEPVTLHFDAEGIVAAGAELKNCFCVGKGKQAILSQHIGDLKNLETYEFYQEAFERFQRLFRVEPKLIACDLHPDYLSTRFAKASGLPTVTVQHHHAHIASCMAEYGLDEPVIGVSFDGTGLGDDSNIWGGEFLICDLKNYQRFSHFAYVPMPGGDKAAEEPWRMGVSYLYCVFGRDFLEFDLPFVRQLDQQKIALLLATIDKGINCPLTSSAGRLFDAVTAIINLVTLSGFEAEAPIRLESIITKTDERYDYQVSDQIIVDKLIEAVLDDLRQQVTNEIIAAKFHNTLAAIIVDLAGRMHAATGINTVILSGGVFQNRYLLERSEILLAEKQFKVLSNQQVPTNDGGICLGQLAVAAKQDK